MSTRLKQSWTQAGAPTYPKCRHTWKRLQAGIRSSMSEEAFAMLSRELSDMMRDKVWPSPPLSPTACCLLVGDQQGPHLRAQGG